MAVFSLKALASFLNPKVLIWGTGVLVAGFVSWNVYGFVDQALDDRERVVRQQIQLELRSDEIDTLNTRLEQAKEAQRISEAARLEAEMRQNELGNIMDNALSAGDEDDGELAPVLQDTLRALRGGSD